MSVITIQWTVYGGWADKVSGEYVHLSRETHFDAALRGGEYVDTGCGDQQVATVFWDAAGHEVVRLAPGYTLSEPFDAFVAGLREGGWR